MKQKEKNLEMEIALLRFENRIKALKKPLKRDLERETLFEKFFITLIMIFYFLFQPLNLLIIGLITIIILLI